MSTMNLNKIMLIIKNKVFDMSKCNFCNKDLERGTGKIVVKKDGKILYFDSMKCEKNLLKLRRDSKRFKWANN